MNEMTNFERIKAMSVEEMAEMLFDESVNHYTYCDGCPYQSLIAPHCSANDVQNGCVNSIQRWLKSETEGCIKMDGKEDRNDI